MYASVFCTSSVLGIKSIRSWGKLVIIESVKKILEKLLNDGLLVVRQCSGRTKLLRNYNKSEFNLNLIGMSIYIIIFIALTCDYSSLEQLQPLKWHHLSDNNIK